MRSDRNSAGPPAASIAHRPKARRTGEADHCPVSERGANGESLGQSGGASLSNCRELRAEGESTRNLGCNFSNNTASCQTELYRREQMRTKRRGGLGLAGVSV